MSLELPPILDIDAMPTPTPASLRKTLDEMIRTDADLQALLIDFFWSTAKEVSVGMDRTTKLNLLFKDAPTRAILAALARAYPAELVQHLHLLELPATHASLHWLCDQLARQLEVRDPSVSQGLAKLRGVSPTDFRVGVLGATSSGKSTLINALLGINFLPSDIRATTVVNVVCRRGETESLVAEYTNRSADTVATRLAETSVGPQATRERMAELCANSGNSNNHKQLEHVLWTHAGVPANDSNDGLPGNTVLIDTPGLGAFSDVDAPSLSLAALLAKYESCLYLVGARQLLSEEEIKSLVVAAAAGRQILLVITKWDIEHDSVESGGLHKPRRRYSLACKQAAFRQTFARRWREASSPLADGSQPAPPPLPPCYFISARTILEQPHTRRSGDFIRLMQKLRALSVTHIWNERRTLAQLINTKLSSLLGCHFDGLHPFQRMEDSDKAMRQRDKNRLEEHKRIIDSINEQQVHLDASRDKLLAHKKDINSKKQSKHEKSFIDNWGDQFFASISIEELHINQIIGDLTATIERHYKNFGISYNAALILVPSLSVSQVHAATTKYRSVNSWWRTVFSTVKLADHHVIIPDERIEVLENMLSERLAWISQIKAHLVTGVIAELRSEIEKLDYVEPREGNVGRPTAPMAWRPESALSLVASIVVRCESELKNLAEKASDEVPIPPSDVVTWTEEPISKGGALLLELGRLYKEAALARRFMACVRETATTYSAKRALRVLLMGPRRDLGLRLTALLRHELADFEEGADGWHELRSCPDAFVQVGPCAELKLKSGEQIAKPKRFSEVIATSEGSLELVIAPASYIALPRPATVALLDWADVVGIFVEASRVSAGAHVLDRDPHVRTLKDATRLPKILLLFGDGALLADWRTALIKQIKPELGLLDKRLNKSLSNNQECFQFAESPWFVFEDYDVLSGEP